MNKIRTLVVMTIAALAMVLGLAALGAGAADHLDAPLVRTDGRLDINDVYTFAHGEHTVLAMTVNPAAGVSDEPITMADIEIALAESTGRVIAILDELVHSRATFGGPAA